MYIPEPITFSTIFFFLLQVIFAGITFVFFVGISVIVINKIDKFTDKEKKERCLVRFIIDMMIGFIAWFIFLAIISYAISLLFN